MAFVFSESTSSTNDVRTADGVFTSCDKDDEQENFALMAYSNSGSNTE
ncbi:hypothetical protein Tco_0605207, partial [Tanacetum coccineum]